MVASPRSLRDSASAAIRRSPARTVAAALSLLAGLVVFWLAVDVFPYHSLNHDEGVYLQQASMLLEGTLRFEPPVDDVFRPWFFVEDGSALYPKYSPVPAATFAAGMLVGLPRLSLAVVAAAVVALTYATVAEAFDRRTGAVAAGLLAATPLFLIQASVFLPYVPTLAWLLLFAWAYLRADRTGDPRWAAVAGLGAGLGFFARPYTAVLFAAPFVAHALWSVWREGRPAVERNLVTAGIGIAGVAATLSYNAVMTGSPLIFPYEAFAPEDGLGFGHRAILGHEVTFTPALSVESSLVALTQYVLRWSVAAPLGVVLALVGAGLVARHGRGADPRKLAVAGLVLTIPIGQLYFWGTFNAIGNLDAPGLGLMGHLGPYYHVGLIVPTAAFAAHALVVGYDALRPRLAAVDSRHVQVGAVTVVLAVALAGGVTAVAAVADPVGDNRAVTDAYTEAYEPIESASFDDALVFLPTPYGDWLSHPFQHLRNDPGFDGDVVYAQDRRVFDVLDAFPDRTPYRYSYRGDWLPVGGDAVSPRLQRLQAVDASTAELTVAAGVPDRSRSAVVRADSDAGEGARTVATAVDGAIRLRVSVAGENATVAGPSVEDPVTVPVERRDDLDLSILVDTGDLSSFGYRLELPIQRTDGTVRAITPRTTVCSDARLCDDGSAYVPGTHRQGVSIETDLWAGGADDE